MIAFRVAGEPQGKGRARAFLHKRGFIGHYTPEKTRSYEGMIRFAAQEAMGERAPLAVPVHLELTAVCSVPASWSKRKQREALSGTILPGKKPDLDNIVKAVTDALNTVVFTDDALIVSAIIGKIYGEAPMIVVQISPAVGGIHAPPAVRTSDLFITEERAA